MANPLQDPGRQEREPLEVMGVLVDPHLEKRRVKANTGRAFRRGCRADLSVAEWMLLLFVYQFHCAYCGRPFETMDHIVPIANGGGTTFTNVLPCCRECNEKKGTAVWL